MKSLLDHIQKKKSKKQKSFALLLDPDAFEDLNGLRRLCRTCEDTGVDLLLLGGSLITNGNLEECLKVIRKHSSIPVFLFPGDNMQLSERAHGILLLSLISGRNPDLLIGRHVLAAPRLKKSALEIIPTAYMLVDGGHITSVSYMSNTTPIPADKADIAACTAMAGELLGLKLIYMDAGSGARFPIPDKMIRQVSRSVKLPVIIGGGIRTPEQAMKSCRAGADLIVVGNAAEKDPDVVKLMVQAVHSV
jgi:phosphoglycerol geranylgeranyltransferase